MRNVSLTLEILTVEVTRALNRDSLEFFLCVKQNFIDKIFGISQTCENAISWLRVVGEHSFNALKNRAEIDDLLMLLE